MCKVSVIIPVYNVENYLKECLDSVINQTMQDIEIICINDGSTDSSLEILREYEKKETRIKVFSQKNGGQSSARNNGITYANGKYIYFLDSDDWIKRETLEYLYDCSEKKHLDILYFGGEGFFENEELKRRFANWDKYYRHTSFLNEIYTGNEFLYNAMSDNSLRVGVPFQFFNREFLLNSDVKFKEGLIYEDELFSTFILLKANRVMRISEIFYIRRARMSSTMTSEENYRNFDCKFIVFMELLSATMFNEYDLFARKGMAKRVQQLYNACKTSYLKLSEAERSNIMKNMPSGYTYIFDELAFDNLLKKEKNVLKQPTQPSKIPTKEHIIKNRTSITIDTKTTNYPFIIRKIIGAIKCCQDHGVIYTIKHFISKCKKYINSHHKHKSTQQSIPKSVTQNKNLNEQSVVTSTIPIEALALRPKSTVSPETKAFGSPCAVSIIIPVYNAEAYIEQCLNSIFNQNFEDFEVICIDDGSKDNSLQILKQYAQMHKNMKVLSQKNQYAGVARNNGLKIANGEYLMFIDADDFIQNNTLEKSYTKAKNTNSDIVIFGADIYEHNTKKFLSAPWQLTTAYLPEKDPFNYKDVPDYIFNITPGGPCNKLFRKQIVEKYNLQFPSFRSNNDIGFVLPFLAVSERITTINEAFYHIRRGLETNLSATKDKNPSLFFDSYQNVQNTLKSLGIYDEIKRSFVNFAMGGCIYELTSIKSPTLRREAEKKFFEEYCVIFDIANKPKEYFFLSNRYKQYCELMENYSFWNEVSLLDINGQNDYSAKVSMIVPIFEYTINIDELFNDLLSQTMPDIEIICIESGINDSTASILQNYSEKYPNISRYSKTLSSVGEAMNWGFKQATGDYVMFINPNCSYNSKLVECLYNISINQKTDISMCLFAKIVDSPNKTIFDLGIRTKNLPETTSFTYDKIKQPLETFSYEIGNKMYKRSLISENNLLFSNIQGYSDISFTALSFINAKKIAYTPHSYVTIKNEEYPSLDDTMKSFMHLYEGLEQRKIFSKYRDSFFIKLNSSINECTCSENDMTDNSFFIDWMRWNLKEK